MKDTLWALTAAQLSHIISGGVLSDMKMLTVASHKNNNPARLRKWKEFKIPSRI